MQLLTPFELPSSPASPLSPEATVSSSRLHGTPAPKFILEEERPWHRAAALMFAAGAVTEKEVAEAFGVSMPTIRNLIRQEWFQARVTQLMAEHGGRDIMTLFKAEAFNSLITLTELRDSAKAPSAVRRAAAVDILDRAYGKPKTFLEQSNSPVSADPVAEVKRLEEDIARQRDNT